jgi:hypothetical protein
MIVKQQKFFGVSENLSRRLEPATRYISHLIGKQNSGNWAE